MFEVRAVPKPSYPRKTLKRKSRSEFSPKVRKLILERDNYQCVRCGRIAEHIHHCIYRSQMGGNQPWNGASVCLICHNLAHTKREVREWFEQFSERLKQQYNVEEWE
ncbi:HNH endonuclease [Effusibacillus dendaii]|uniref:HNH nuclease domain-containing protein n=1 Tax=Effusibacillus dendaii TaxID=2743772 RepID=A0A7I8D908_9BACL|nr:HNH endonuclease [Effusibacillus dendaii]BCJ86487.1 hypothetical protein skT53_14720 [Effusibacillus dendaii]